RVRLPASSIACSVRSRRRRATRKDQFTIMADQTGLLVRFDEPRRADLIQRALDGIYEPFSDALSIHDWNFRSAQVAFLSFSEATIDYVAIARKGKQVVKWKSRVDFSSIVPLDSI